MIDRQQMLKIAFHAGLLSLSIALTLGAQQPTWSSGTYVYDNNGNISVIGTDTFAYDAANRLLSGTAGPGRNQMYRYDAFGNLAQIVTDGQVTLIPGVDPATNQITVPVGQTAASGLVVTATGQYDGAGNMTGFQNGLYTFAYDGLNMLKDYQGGGRHEIYIYTPDNERIAVATVSGSGASATVNSTRWTIRGLDHKVLREFDDANPSGGHMWSWKEDWIYANGQLIAAENDQPDHTLHFFSDHLGTPRLITGSGGAVIARHTYYPFGEEATSPAQDAEVMKFTGHERDSLLDNMHARFTDAALGRFLSVDPVEGDPQNPQSWNRYAYVRNNPINRIDPTGRCSAVVFGAAICAAVDTIQSGIERGGQVVQAAHGMGPSASAQENAMGAAVLAIAAVDVGSNFIEPGEGKATKILENAATGKLGEAIVRDQLVSEGKTVLGSQVSVQTSEGRRVIDHLVQDGGGVRAVEVKTGNATRNARQVAKDSAMANEGGKIVGKNAPPDLRGKIMKVITDVWNVLQ
jgi:RHS repeat-associated protein